MPLPIVRLTPELTSSSPWDWALWLHHAIELDNGSPCPLPALIDLSENSEENSQFLQQLNNASLKPSSCTGSISQPIRSGGCIWPQQGNDLNAVGREPVNSVQWWALEASVTPRSSELLDSKAAVRLDWKRKSGNFIATNSMESAWQYHWLPNTQAAHLSHVFLEWKIHRSNANGQFSDGKPAPEEIITIQHRVNQLVVFPPGYRVLSCSFIRKDPRKPLVGSSENAPATAAVSPLLTRVSWFRWTSSDSVDRYFIHLSSRRASREKFAFKILNCLYMRAKDLFQSSVVAHPGSILNRERVEALRHLVSLTLFSFKLHFGADTLGKDVPQQKQSMFHLSELITSIQTKPDQWRIESAIQSFFSANYQTKSWVGALLFPGCLNSDACQIIEKHLRSPESLAIFQPDLQSKNMSVYCAHCCQEIFGYGLAVSTKLPTHTSMYSIPPTLENLQKKIPDDLCSELKHLCLDCYSGGIRYGSQKWHCSFNRKMITDDVISLKPYICSLVTIENILNHPLMSAYKKSLGASEKAEQWSYNLLAAFVYLVEYMCLHDKEFQAVIAKSLNQPPKCHHCFEPVHWGVRCCSFDLCKEVYCVGCLQAFHNKSWLEVVSPSSSWQCFHCINSCSCTKCIQSSFFMNTAEHWVIDMEEKIFARSQAEDENNENQPSTAVQPMVQSQLVAQPMKPPVVNLSNTNSQPVSQQSSMTLVKDIARASLVKEPLVKPSPPVNRKVVPVVVLTETPTSESNGNRLALSKLPTDGQVKRKRGRPRKYPLPAISEPSLTEASSSDSDDEDEIIVRKPLSQAKRLSLITQPKKRGRPRKYPLSLSAQSSRLSAPAPPPSSQRSSSVEIPESQEIPRTTTPSSSLTNLIQHAKNWSEIAQSATNKDDEEVSSSTEDSDSSFTETRDRFDSQSNLHPPQQQNETSTATSMNSKQQGPMKDLQPSGVKSPNRPAAPAPTEILPPEVMNIARELLKLSGGKKRGRPRKYVKFGTRRIPVAALFGQENSNRPPSSTISIKPLPEIKSMQTPPADVRHPVDENRRFAVQSVMLPKSPAETESNNQQPSNKPPAIRDIVQD